MRSLGWLPLALVLLAVHSVAGLSCAMCRPERCKEQTNCKHGLVKDTCSCCMVCGKGPGERCGGPWDIAGRCGDGLFCKKHTNHEHPFAEFNANGKCRREQQRRPLPRDDDVVFPDAEHVQQDEMERAARHQPGALDLLRLSRLRLETDTEHSSRPERPGSSAEETETEDTRPRHVARLAPFSRSRHN